jgi:His-Xaa-Ser system radical SAM maturase HxsB
MKRKDFAIIPFNSAMIKDKYLVTSVLGRWDLLDKEEFGLLHSLRLQKNSPLFNRLYEKGLIADEGNIENLIDNYRNLNAHLFNDTSLHIAVVTTRCNLKCSYCQTKSLNETNMNYEVASRILKYIFDVRSPCISLEFQGGEPLLNWEVLAFLIEHSRKFNTIGKDLKLALVSNLTLLDEKKMKFLTDFDVEICASLDGPKEIHDKNRVFPNGKGSYDTVTNNIKKLSDKFGKKVNLLPTITKYSLNYFKELIDEYVRLGQIEISLRPVNKMGVACTNWSNIGFSVEEFNEFYKNSMDYILDLNKRGVLIKERIARVILEKMLNGRDTGYVELMNPCGAGRITIVYMPDGTCYPCDEARMAGEEMFKLGNILKENYEDLMKKDTLLHLLESSLVNLWDYNSAFSPWMGTCPIVNYVTQKNIVPKIWCSSMHKIYNYQFRYIFEKIIEGKENLEIFKKWVKGEGDNEKESQKGKIQQLQKNNKKFHKR